MIGPYLFHSKNFSNTIARLCSNSPGSTGSIGTHYHPLCRGPPATDLCSNSPSLSRDVTEIVNCFSKNVLLLFAKRQVFGKVPPVFFNLTPALLQRLFSPERGRGCCYDWEQTQARPHICLLSFCTALGSEIRCYYDCCELAVRIEGVLDKHVNIQY